MLELVLVIFLAETEVVDTIIGAAVDTIIGDGATITMLVLLMEVGAVVMVEDTLHLRLQRLQDPRHKQPLAMGTPVVEASPES